MFFKNLKNKFLLLTFITTLIIPSSAFAYSDYIIAGGENIGIELNSKGILVVGTYEVNGKNPAKEANLQNGDKIVKINEKEVSNIEEMLNVIESSTNKESLLLTYIRGDKEHNTTLNLQKSDNNIYKTGLYVKDSITGVGTLTFIDPNTKLFGALGHEIIEKNTGQKLEIKDGKIYSSTVTSITRSDNGRPGEKNAKYDSNMVFGSVFENTSQGIFGNYTNSIPQKKLYQVGTVDKITTGDAKILTVIEEENVEEFTINILKVNGNLNSSKNILFEVTDNKLLKNTGGIVQGMSGSPIIQNDYIIGAVTYVVVDDPTKGYGILITKMLEEAEN